ncbi:MAG TPA: SPFH domain-containing protein [Candidatus Paceibacterota bacterium]|nr:SPFH domain-containing protein [Candidatus Paceibacterota bacterium]
MFRNYFLRNTGLSTGIAVGFATSAFVLFLFALTAILFFDGFWLPIMTIAIGVFISIVSGALVYNHGITEVAETHRGLLLWFGARIEPEPDGTAYEIEEGTHWLLKVAGIVRVNIFDTKPRLALLKPVEVETENDVEVPTELAVIYRPKAGRLYYFSMIPNPVAMFTPAAHSAARVFGEMQPTVDALVRNGPAMEEAIARVLQNRSDGLNQAFCVSCDKVEFDDETGSRAEFTKEDKPVYTKQWGIEIDDVEITDFDIPESITSESAKVVAAEKRAQAATIINNSINEVAKNVPDGVDGTTALAHARSLVAPETDQSVAVRHFSADPATLAALAALIGAGGANRKPQQGRRDHGRSRSQGQTRE